MLVKFAMLSKLFAGVLAAGGLGLCLAQAAEKPNILWIVAEDINPHLGCYGDTNATTPNLDRFAAQALRYRTCWSAAPVCAPARTALISGVYPTSTGAEHMRSLVPAPATLRPYPQLLRDQGYYCVNNSKQDYNLEFAGKLWDESSGKAHYRNRQPGQPFFAAFNIELTHESRIRKRPHTLSHDPGSMRLPAYHPDTPEVRHDWAQYYDNITAMDAVFGQRLKELDEAGLGEDTIVFFYGDNGGGMPRSKRWLYDSGLRVPLIIRVPQKFKHLAPADFKPGAETGRLVSFVDFAPTLLSLAGAPPPAWMQGEAFMGGHPAPARKYLFGFRGRMDERFDMVRSARNDRYVYIRNYLPHLVYGRHLDYMFQTPTTRVWKELYDQGKLEPPQTLFWQTKPPEELYDSEADPDEVRNLAGSPRVERVLAELRGALREHLMKTRDLGFLTETEMHRRAGNRPPFELTQDGKAYPFAEVLEMAEMASALAPDSLSALKKGLRHKDSAVRYWAAAGILMRGSNAVSNARSELKAALQDESPSVGITAAHALGRFGSEEELALALAVLVRYAPPEKNGEQTALLAVDAIDALGGRGARAREQLKTMALRDPAAPERGSGYVERIVSGW